jgi:hypothetical protein
VGHRLPCLGPVLEGNVEGALLGGSAAPRGNGGSRGARGRDKVVAGQHALDALHGGKQVGQLGRREVGQAAVRAQRAHQDVPRQQRLEVDEGEGVGGLEEDLARGLVSMAVRVRIKGERFGLLGL